MNALDDLKHKNSLTALEFSTVFMGVNRPEDAEKAAAELTALRARIASLEAALVFYAHPARYRGSNQQPFEGDPHQPADCPYLWDVMRDGGKIARAALEQK